ncbi:MAG: LysM peptidoglycan-binding domain-containing protein [Deltaproteobacteria bacterium]|nr:LysM peptidoglycan-binding domain-containing protein [Deltaproteobacteria bacterium]MBN2688571.1 LysM peptidoglycan-binding domain-containing protein [Deltaproteobacteria bacterium]
MAIATECEKKGQLNEALKNWKIVSAFKPGDQDALNKVKSLEKSIAFKADRHFKRGVAFYKKGSIRQARREFLLCLSYDSKNSKALDYIKNNLREKVYTTYVIKKGDTLKKIADKTYENPNIDFLITYFNDLEKNTPLKQGTTLKLPMASLIPSEEPERVTETEPESTDEIEPEKKTGINLDQLMYKAVYLFNNKKYEQAIAQAKLVLEQDITNKEAIKFFEQMDEEAEAHYRQGVKFYIDENIRKSIEEWRITLILNPDHQKAKTEIEKARGLLKKLKEMD